MYEVNDVPLLLCPTSARWLNRDSVGIDGSSRNTYVPNRSFELGWSIMSVDQFAQLCDLYDAVANTGTADIVLPGRCVDLWTGIHYTVKLDEPTTRGYWNTYHVGVRMRIRNIRT